MALNTQNFKDGINTIGSNLNKGKNSKNIIEQSKKKLLNLFLDNAPETVEEADVIINHIKDLINAKIVFNNNDTTISKNIYNQRQKIFEAIQEEWRNFSYAWKDLNRIEKSPYSNRDKNDHKRKILNKAISLENKRKGIIKKLKSIHNSIFDNQPTNPNNNNQPTNNNNNNQPTNNNNNNNQPTNPNNNNQPTNPNNNNNQPTNPNKPGDDTIDIDYEEIDKKEKYEAERARIEAIIDPEERKAAEIEFVMKNLFAGVGEAAANKIKEYADRIISGKQTREKVIEGLSPSFVQGIDDLLAAQGRKETQSPTTEKDDTAQEPQAEKDLKKQLEETQAELEKQKKINILKDQANLGSEEDKARIKQLEDEQAKMQIQLADMQKLLESKNIPSERQDIFNQLDQGKKLRLLDHNDNPFEVYKEGDKYFAVDRSNQVGEQPRGEISKNDIMKLFGPKIIHPNEKGNEESKEKSKPTLESTITNTKNNLFGALTIDAHLMDKENLIYESERNRIRDLSERKYESANRFKKIGMFATDRHNQRRDLKDSMQNAINSNDFIENGPLQERIDGMIGTYAHQTDMGMENLTVQKDATTPLYNNNIDNLAHAYITGSITRDVAITAFNNALRADGRLSSGMGKERMTGTDLMKQIDSQDRISYLIKTSLFAHIKNTYNNSFPTQLSETDITAVQTTLAQFPILEKTTISPDKIHAQLDKMKTDKIDENIEKINTDSFRVRVKLFKITKTENTEELEGVKYDTNQSWIMRNINSVVNIVPGYLRTPLSIALKVGIGVGIAAVPGGAPLYALLGVMGTGTLMQALKTYRDSTREIVKTHEDAINLGLPELERRIADLEAQQQNAGIFARIGATMGRNARNRRAKQLKILDAFREMRQHTNTLKSVDSIIHDLNTPSDPEFTPQIMSELLARIDMGHKYQTQFISTSDEDGNPLGRQQTAIKRNQMMEALKQRALHTPLQIINDDGTITTISVNETSKPDERARYRQVLKTNPNYPHYESFSTYLSDNYKTVQHNIKSARRGLGTRSALQYAGNTAAAAIAVGGIKAGIDAFSHTPSAGGAVEGVTETSTKSLGEQSQFKLSQYQNGNETQLPNTESFSTLNNGDVIENVKAEVSVDAVAAKTGAFNNYLEVADQVRTEIGGLGLDATTTKTLQDALSTAQIEDIMKQAADAGADIGNQKLATLRWTNMIENFAKELHDNNLNEVVVKNIKREESIGDMAIQASKNGLNNADITHRGWALVAEAVSPTSEEIIEIPIQESVKDFRPRETYLAGVFPFFNTYAKPGNDQWALKDYNNDNKKDKPKRKIWSKQNDQKKENNQSHGYQQAA